MWPCFSMYVTGSVLWRFKTPAISPLFSSPPPPHPCFVRMFQDVSFQHLLPARLPATMLPSHYGFLSIRSHKPK